MTRPSPPRINLAFALTLALIAAASLHGCSDDRGPDAEAPPGPATPAPGPAEPAGGADVDTDVAVQRPDTATDTLRIEGMPQEIGLRLFSTPDGFPLRFTTYVPEDMAAEADTEGTVRFVAEFGGRRSTDAFVHLLVHPEGTDREVAVGTARAYKTGRGVPVSQGLEPIADELRPPHLAWAVEAYRFGYEGEGGWYVGTIGVGRHGGRFYQIVRHNPAEYGDGFGPRAGLILETWRWADGTGLSAPRATPRPSPARPEPGTAPGDSTGRP